MTKVKIIKFDKKYADETATMWRNSKEMALGQKDEVHTRDEQLYFLVNILAKENQVYLALEITSDKVVGLIAFDTECIDQLYIDHSFQQQGIGSQLLAIAITNRTRPVQLHTFEVNVGAQIFYEKHGLKIISRGSCDNEEKLQDIIYELTF